MSAYIKKLHISVYGWDVYFFTDRAKSLKWLKALEGIRSETLEAWRDECSAGVCSTYAEKLAVYIGIFTDRPNTVAHECTHAAVHLLGGVGIPVKTNNHEALAYLVGHLVGEFHDAALKNTKRKK